jgi:S-adenosylmethionine decarboxylase
MLNKKYTQFGYHLTLDFYNCPKDKLSDIGLCYQILEKLPSALGMKPLSPPYVIEAPSNEKEGGKDPGGITGYIVIAESHISLHTFTLRGFVSLDVYSCKKFDYSKAIKYLERNFEPKSKEIHKINRGRKYPTKNIY